MDLRSDSRAIRFLELFAGVIAAGVTLFLITLMRYWRQKPLRLTGDSVEEKRVLSAAGTEPLKSFRGFNWEARQPAQHRPFKPIYHINMALQSDTPSDLITIDQGYLDRINIRKQLIQTQGEKVHGHIPAASCSIDELYQYLTSEYLPTCYPTVFRLRHDTIENLVTGDTYPLETPLDPNTALTNLGKTVEEDLFLLQSTPQGHQVMAFMCCFPSGWRPHEKLGRNMSAIHANVPHYDKIGPSMERYFGKLQVGKSVKRKTWTCQTHDELYNVKGNHVHGNEKAEAESIDPTKAFVRLEVQTLTRLPKSQAILFSFKTYLYPIADIKAEGLGPQCADAIQGFQKGNAPGMWKYKGAIRWGEGICEYLRA